MSDEEFSLISTRTISGAGVVPLPQELKYRYFYLYFNVIRLPSIDYRNFESNPSRGFFARLCSMRDKYVLDYREMRFQSEVLHFPRREPGDWLINPLICNFSALNAKLNTILSLLGAPPPVPSSEIKWLPVETYPDRIQVVCRDDTALSCEVWAIEVRKDCPEAGEGGAPPPPKDLPSPPPFPPGTPIEDISPPEPDFPGDTAPFPGDGEAPPDTFPVGGECQQVRVTGFAFETPRGSGTVLEFFFERVFWGTIEGENLVDGSPSEVGSDYAYLLLSRGRADDGGVCQASPGEFVAVTPASNFIEAGSFGVRGVTFEPL